MTATSDPEPSRAGPGPALALRGLIVDWGGVLTTDMRSAVADWARDNGIDEGVYVGIMRDWLGAAYGAEAAINPIHALERGEMEIPDFEARLADELSRRGGGQYASEGLLARLLAQYEHAPDMNGLVRRAHEAGLATALLSNSWGADFYPRDGWDDMFDVVVISGEVGMRKPERQIYELTLERLGLAAGECVFVDDIRANVAAAVELGIVGVRHVDYEQTRAELEVLFGRDLS